MSGGGDIVARVRDLAVSFARGGPAASKRRRDDNAHSGAAREHDAALRVLDGVSFEVRRGELLAVVGPSGCGKSTLLQVVIGLLTPSAGAVELLAGKPAMVFQRPSLLPWRTIVDNAAYGLECRGVARDEARRRAEPALRAVGLAEHLHDRPHQLSEGMKQRVNLARALVTQPELLLLDEPFAALDALTRQGLHDDLLALRAERGFTALLVSHSLDEVAYLADRVLVFSDKPTRVASELNVELPRPRGADAAARLALLEVAETLRERLAGATPAAGASDANDGGSEGAGASRSR